MGLVSPDIARMARLAALRIEPAHAGELAADLGAVVAWADRLLPAAAGAPADTGALRLREDRAERTVAEPLLAESAGRAETLVRVPGARREPTR